jgi:hypothetical protein
VRRYNIDAGGIATMGELAAELIELANRSHHDRDDMIAAAKTILARTDSATAASYAGLSWP